MSLWLETVPQHFPKPPKILSLPTWKFPDGSWEAKVREDYFSVSNRWCKATEVPDRRHRYSIFCTKQIETHPDLAVRAARHIQQTAVLGAQMLKSPWLELRFSRALGYTCLNGSALWRWGH